MIETFLMLMAVTLGWLALLTLAIFAGRRLSWVARPPAIDLIIISFTVVPWVGAWEAGRRMQGHWSGGLAGLVAAVAAQFAALELFELIHSQQAARRGTPSFEINRTLGRRHGAWRNRMALWVTVPSVPFFLLARMGQFTGYGPLILLLGFTKFRHSDYITVSRQKIRNLVGADLVWCLYCDWMVGLWSLSTEMLNEVESYWCPLTFADQDKCEKCARFFRMDEWAPVNAGPQEMSQLIGKVGGGGRKAEVKPVCPAPGLPSDPGLPKKPSREVVSTKP